MKKFAFLGMLTMGMVVLFASCAKVPQAAIDGAQAAVDSAKIAEAAVYVPEQLTALEDSMKSALAEVETQKSKFFANYDKAASTLTWVSANAGQVAQNAVTRKAQLKEEIVAVIAEVTASLAENKELVAKAPKGKEGKAALEAINSELSVVEATIAECQTAYDNGQYVGTIDKIKAAKDKAASIKEELTAAIDKTKKK
ncbi:hypothetical protein LX69_02740 [Breznakibacter xylanolyticus]|uniref:DUF4398 domain-containing protein n=1 Tax=Breznakibacter xylanolyticus TaxID=990 RepID=A0A2W7NIE5_9BACT|nr:hypothetical protein [Breznakibacter xylanolyticus]MBN2744791.1 hypothetical protein [Marinilabiliaceae bacterium]PZX12936.1 hypothetical protein LX69_02740 [Breznakibacter xylanolyticus]